MYTQHWEDKGRTIKAHLGYTGTSYLRKKQNNNNKKNESHQSPTWQAIGNIQIL
jgi:hypothetical protein